MKWIIGLLASLAFCISVFAQGSKVSFRHDHTILVNDKPFFPIGLYYCSEEFEDTSDQLLKNLRAIGFNTLGYYRWGTPRWKEEMDRADRLGFIPRYSSGSSRTNRS